MSIITFQAALRKIDSWTVLVLPKDASAKLSSRGMVMAEGTVNGFRLQTALEPDGKGSHWLKVDAPMRKAINAEAGDAVTLAIEQTTTWPEPEIPTDLLTALTADPQAHVLWLDITPAARWDWLRWIRATTKQETRKHRIEVALSKLKAGERRPCCFNRILCTEPSVSKNGVLLDSVQ